MWRRLLIRDGQMDAEAEFMALGFVWRPSESCLPLTLAEETTPMATHGDTEQRIPQRGHGAIRPTRIAAIAAAAAALMMMTVVGTSGASGERIAHETHCWTMTPSEDELKLEVALVAPPMVGFYTIFAHWRGEHSYFFEGAGDGQVSHNGERVSVSFLCNEGTKGYQPQKAVGFWQSAPGH
jgi:hypothetical protein